MSVVYKPAGESRGIVFEGVGHGGSDPGAVKYLREATINLKQALYAKDYLVAQGFTVVMSRNKDENDPLTEEIREANASGAICAVDFHNNAGGGDGFEAIHSIVSNSTGGKALAKAIEREVKAIGQNSRGIKTRKNNSGSDYFGFVRQTKMPAVIIEGCFVDNKKDVKDFDTDAELKAYGEAVAKGIINWLEDTGRVKRQGKVTTATANFKVKVIDDELNIRKGAGTGYKKIGCITDHGVYTIIETKTIDGVKWGKLKSSTKNNPKWICIDSKFVKRV